jgi:hypothetical protein
MLTNGRADLPTVHWRELTPVELASPLETADDLLHLLQRNRGDPRLTAWEEAFLTGMGDCLEIGGAGTEAVVSRLISDWG